MGALYTYDISHINSEQQHGQTEAFPFYVRKLKFWFCYSPVVSS